MTEDFHKNRVRFFYNNGGPYIRGSKLLKKFIEEMFRKEGRSLDEFNFVFCSDSFLLSINKKYLGHDYKTDIITFNFSENSKRIKGESYISIDRVRDNAQRLKISYRKEILRVIFHGVLHLCGYDDKTTKDSLIIREKEDFYLRSYLYN